MSDTTPMESEEETQLFCYALFLEVRDFGFEHAQMSVMKAMAVDPSATARATIRLAAALTKTRFELVDAKDELIETKRLLAKIDDITRDTSS